MAREKKRKKFFDVEMPLINKTTQLQAYEISGLEGRYIKYDLTRMLRGKSVELRLKVEVKNNEVTTVPIQLKIMPYFIRRIIRKGTNYVEDSFSTHCKNAKITLKPFLITRRKVSRAVRNALRVKAKEELINYAKDRDNEEIFDDLLKNKLQKQLSLTLKKIYPLAFCDIRIFTVEK